MGFYPRVQAHVTVVHKFEDYPSFERLYTEIEHPDALLSGRRQLEELWIDFNL